MTTVAYDGKTLAADRRMNGWEVVGKIFPLGDGRYFSGAGAYDDIAEVAAWIAGGCKKSSKPDVSEDEKDDNSCYVIASPEGLWWVSTPHLRQIKSNNTIYATGTGAAYALGAMAMGASAKRAVEIASQFDPQTGSGVDVVNLRTGRRTLRSPL